MSSGKLLDVTQEIKIDHDNVRDLFERYQKAIDLKQKRAIANTLIRKMSTHSNAEYHASGCREIFVYNDYAAVGLGDTAVHDKEEHAKVKKLVYDADTTPMTDSDYDYVLPKAIKAFDSHAWEEENEQHPALRERLSSEMNDKIALGFLSTRKKVPSRPHPLTSQTCGIAQKEAAVHGQLQDKTSEKIIDRDFVEVKYVHPADDTSVF